MGNLLPIKTIKSNETGITHCSYTPKSTLPHVIEVNYGQVAAAESPYRVYISNPPDVTRIRVFGDWFETKSKLNTSSTFYIDTTDVDIADLNVWLIHEESNRKIPIRSINNDNGIYTVEIQVENVGNYLTKIYYGGIPIPIKQKVYVPSNANSSTSIQNLVYPENVRVFGKPFDGSQLRPGIATYFNIDVSEAGTGIVAVSIFNMHGVPVDNVFVVNKGGGLYTVNFIVPDEKSIIISVKFAHQHVSSR